MNVETLTRFAFVHHQRLLDEAAANRAAGLGRPGKPPASLLRERFSLPVPTIPARQAACPTC